MRIIVTGGMGYIGSHTVVELLSNDIDVHIIDNLSNSDITMLDRIHEICDKDVNFTQLDLRNKEDVISFFENESHIDGVIHFAALKSVGESVQDPIKYYENNLSGLNNLLIGMAIQQVPSLVFSSSATVYGRPKILPVTEDTPIGNTPSPYGATKQMCERIIEDFTQANSWLSAISLRYFNPIGAHESGIIGELPSGIPNNLMPYITQTAAGIRKKLYVFGEDYNTPDGTAIRDYIHVSDVATAHVNAIRFLKKEHDNSHIKINIGTGRGSSVIEVIRAFEKSNNLKLNYEMTNRREGDVETVFAEVSLAEKLLNWKAVHTLEEMTKTAWEWEKKLRQL